MPPKRNRDNAAVGEGHTGLMRHLIDPDHSVKDIAHDYVSQYDNDQNQMLSEIIELIMVLTGSKAKLTDDIFKSIGKKYPSSYRASFNKCFRKWI